MASGARHDSGGGGEDYLATWHLAADLRKRSLRGGVATLTGQFGQFAAQLISTVVLARLLGPSDFGLVAMVSAITWFLAIFQDLGLSTATIQKHEISHDEVTALFWVNVAVSFALALMVVGLAPVLAFFYHQPQLIGIARVMSLGFILGGLGIQHQAILQRQMRFTTLAAINVASYSAGAAVAVAMALAGAGYWALVALPLVPNGARTAAWWVACRWRPGRLRRTAGLRDLLAFGGYLTGFNTVNYVARNLDNVLIGWRWGPAALGQYSRAYSLLLMPLQQISIPISNVAISALSRLQDDPDRYRRAYRQILEKLTLLTSPLVAFLIGTSGWVIAVVLGPQWQEAARIFAWLGVAALVQPIAGTAGWLFTTQHRGRELLTWGFIGAAIAVTSFVVGLPYGPVGVAEAYAMSNVLVFTPALIWHVGRRGPVSSRDIVAASLRPWLLGLAVLVAIATLRFFLPGLRPVPGLALAAAVSGTLMAGVLVFSRLGRETVGDIRDLLAGWKKGAA